MQIWSQHYQSYLSTHDAQSIVTQAKVTTNLQNKVDLILQDPSMKREEPLKSNELGKPEFHGNFEFLTPTSPS